VDTLRFGLKKTRNVGLVRSLCNTRLFSNYTFVHSYIRTFVHSNIRAFVAICEVKWLLSRLRKLLVQKQEEWEKRFSNYTFVHSWQSERISGFALDWRSC